MQRVRKQIEADFLENEVMGRSVTVAVLDTGERVAAMSGAYLELE